MTTPSKAVSGAAAAAAAPGNRILYYDAIESFAIFLVVAVHSVWLNGNIPASISMSLSPAAVPLFFMVHGALLLGRPDSPRKHLRRSLRVVFQLLAWSVIYLMISLLFSWNKQPLTPRSLYKHYMHAGILNGTMGLGGSLWFIYALIAVYLLHPVLHALRGTRQLGYLAFLLLVFTFGGQAAQTYGKLAGRLLGIEIPSPEYLFTFFDPLGRYGNCVCYYILGHLLASWLQQHKKLVSQNKRLFLLSAFGVFLAGITLLMIERRIEFGTFSYNWKPLPDQYYRIGGILEAAGIFCLFSQIRFPAKCSRVFTALSTHTIDIYYIHPIIVRLIYDRFFIQAYAGVIQNYLRALIALLISFWLGQLIRKIPVLKSLL